MFDFKNCAYACDEYQGNEGAHGLIPYAHASANEGIFHWHHIHGRGDDAHHGNAYVGA